MQKVIEHLMVFLNNHLSNGAPGPHRGLPPGAGAADRAADVASHRLKHHLNRYPVPEWLPAPSVAWVHQRNSNLQAAGAYEAALGHTNAYA